MRYRYIVSTYDLNQSYNASFKMMEDAGWRIHTASFDHTTARTALSVVWEQVYTSVTDIAARGGETAWPGGAQQPSTAVCNPDNECDWTDEIKSANGHTVIVHCHAPRALGSNHAHVLGH